MAHVPPLQQPPANVRQPALSCQSDSAAVSSIERFDPTALRCEVLRRSALASRLGLAGDRGVGEDWEDQLFQWLANTARAAWHLLRRGQHQVERTGTATTASGAVTAGGSSVGAVIPGSGHGAGLAPGTGTASERSEPASASGSQSLGSSTQAAGTGTAATTAQHTATETAAGTAPATETTSPRPGRMEAGMAWALGVRDKIAELIRQSVFLSFPKDSIFADPAVEELFQRQCIQYWTPSLNWTVAAMVQIPAWDFAAGHGHRLSLAVHFYGAFIGMVLLHKAFFVSLRGRPWGWRRNRALLLYGFLLCRSVVCHPLPEAFSDAEQGPTPNQGLPWLLHVVAQSGIVATGLILVLHLQKLDTLLVFVTHGVSCGFWAGYATLHLLSDDASWHHPAAMHLMLAYVCVWMQHQREQLDRHTFEQKLLMERGRLLRASESLIRQGTRIDFSISMQLLYQARSLEHITF